MVLCGTLEPWLHSRYYYMFYIIHSVRLDGRLIRGCTGAQIRVILKYLDLGLCWVDGGRNDDKTWGSLYY